MEVHVHVKHWIATLAMVVKRSSVVTKIMKRRVNKTVGSFDEILIRIAKSGVY